MNEETLIDDLSKLQSSAQNIEKLSACSGFAYPSKIKCSTGQIGTSNTVFEAKGPGLLLMFWVYGNNSEVDLYVDGKKLDKNWFYLRSGCVPNPQINNILYHVALFSDSDDGVFPDDDIFNGVWDKPIFFSNSVKVVHRTTNNPQIPYRLVYYEL